MEKALTGNKDADLQILAYIDDRSLFSFCLTSVYAKTLCDYDSFWMNRFFTHFGRNLSKYKNNNETWKKYYLYFAHWYNKLKEEFNFESKELEDDPRKYYKKMNKIMKRLDKSKLKKKKIKFWEKYYGAKFGSPEYINHIFNDIMFLGVEQNYMDLVEFAIRNGANNYQGGLNYTAFSGNFRMLNFFENLGANNYEEALDYANDGRHNKKLNGNKAMISHIENKLRNA